MFHHEQPARHAWTKRSRLAHQLESFHHTEHGSALDMLDAVERSDNPTHRRLHFMHAIDEFEHAAFFGEVARELAPDEDLTVGDSQQLLLRGIRREVTLVDEMSTPAFFAFLWHHEARALDIFHGVIDRAGDPDFAARFAQVLKDEAFHVSYTRAQLDTLDPDGIHASSHRTHLLHEMGQRVLHAADRLGRVMAGVWLTLLYIVVVGPFGVWATVFPEKSKGFQTPTTPRAAENPGGQA